MLSRLFPNKNFRYESLLLPERLIVSLLLFMAVSSVLADNLADAKLAIRMRQYDRAVALLQPVARQGNPEAQHQLASMYRTGRGINKDYEIAFQLMRQAAQQGHIKAEYNLGMMYDQGLGTERNVEQAKYWYQQAATSNYTPAINITCCQNQLIIPG